MDVQTSRQLLGAPKYLQLREAMLAMIRDEALPPGHLLPSENELCERFGVSRGTIRRAFDDLERDGHVSRQPGRGTFVASPRMERPLAELTSFSEHIESLGMTPGAELVSYREGTDYAEGKGHFPEGELLARIVRVRTANVRPVGVHTLLLPVDLAVEAGFSARALRADPALSLYRSLSAIGIESDLARESIAARRATAQESRRLELGAHEPVLEVVRQSYGINSRPIELVRAVYRADRYDYTTWLRRPGGTDQQLKP
jgi:GntR family transcriptional regulator